jgi:hypothetical protein
LLLLPPLFTGGDCTREFDQETRRVGADQPAYRTPEMARAYWNGRDVSYSVIAPDQCRKSRPRYVDACGRGPLVVGRIPVKNTICSVYRDDEIRVQLQYDDRGRLERVQSDMKPFKSLPLPFVDHTIHWGR